MQSQGSRVMYSVSLALTILTGTLTSSTHALPAAQPRPGFSMHSCLQRLRSTDSLPVRSLSQLTKSAICQQAASKVMSSAFLPPPSPPTNAQVAQNQYNSFTSGASNKPERPNILKLHLGTVETRVKSAQTPPLRFVYKTFSTNPGMEDSTDAEGAVGGYSEAARNGLEERQNRPSLASMVQQPTSDERSLKHQMSTDDLRKFQSQEVMEAMLSSLQAKDNANDDDDDDDAEIFESSPSFSSSVYDQVDNVREESPVSKRLSMPRWFAAFSYRPMSKRRRTLSINNALVSLSDMLVARGIERLNRNRQSMRRHMLLQG